MQSAPSPTHSLSRRLGIDWRTELLVLAMVAAETAALWLVVDLVAAAMRADSHRAPAAAVCGLIYLGSALPRWLEALDVWDPAYGLVMALAIAASTLILVKTASFPHVPWLDPVWLGETARALAIRSTEARMPVWVMIATSAYAWWRGKTRTEPGPDAAFALLRVGTLVMLAAAVGQTVVRSSEATRTTSAAVLAFFAAALAAVAIARLRPEGARGTATLGPRWLGPLLAPVLIIAVAAVAAAGLLSRQLLDTLLWILAPLVWALSIVFRIIILALAIVAFILVSPILWLLSLHPIDVAGIRWQPIQFEPQEIVQRATARAANLPDPIRYLIATAVLMLLFSGVTRLTLRRRHRAGLVTGEDRASVLDAREVAELLKSLAHALLPRRRGATSDPLAALRRDPRWAHTVAIRETYARFLRWSRDRGMPRSPATTPLEHKTALSARLRGAGARHDLTTITDRYNAARYGAAPATAEDAEAVRKAWRRLSRARAESDRMRL